MLILTMASAAEIGQGWPQHVQVQRFADVGHPGDGGGNHPAQFSVGFARLPYRGVKRSGEVRHMPAGAAGDFKHQPLFGKNLFKNFEYGPLVSVRRGATPQSGLVCHDGGAQSD